MTRLITAIEEVTPDWLSLILKQSVASVESESVDAGRWGNKWRLRATCADGSVWRMFLKTSDNPHEARFYQATHHNQDGLPVVPCYDVVIAGDKSHILLQDLSETHEACPPSQLPPLGRECEAIIDGLANLHARWWQHPQLETTFGGAPSAEAIRRSVIEGAALYPQFAQFLGDRLPPQRRALYERALENLPDLMVQRFAQGNLTLIFEDVHSGNFLYPRQPDDKLYFIDWEQWGVSVAMNDLAYMMALFWSPERRARLEIPYLKRYHARIQAQGVDYAWDALWYDYRLLVMRHLLIPVWQWSRNHIVDVWWNHLERITAAFEDLGCVALLTT